MNVIETFSVMLKMLQIILHALLQKVSTINVEPNKAEKSIICKQEGDTKEAESIRWFLRAPLCGAGLYVYERRSRFLQPGRILASDVMYFLNISCSL